MVGTLVSAVIAVFVGIVLFGVTKGFLADQDTSTWSATEQTLMTTAIPIGIALLVFWAVFGTVGKKMGGGNN